MSPQHRQDTGDPPETTLGQKIALGLGGVMVCLLFLEALLRLAGWWYNLRYPVPRDQHADYRIFCVGESTTFGVGAADPPRDSYPRQLEIMLNQRFPGLRAQCLYDQSVGVSTSQLLMNLPGTLKSYQPDLVIFMAGLNNWGTLNKSYFLLFNRNEKVWPVALKVSAFLEESRVFKLLKWIAYSHRWVTFETITRIEEDEVNDDPVYMQKRDAVVEREVARVERQYDWRAFHRVAEQDLRQMIRLCLARHIKVIICTYPGSVPEEVSAVHRRLARELGLVLVDNEALFNALPDKPGYFSIDMVHPNQKGYRELAGYVFKAMLDHHMVTER